MILRWWAQPHRVKAAEATELALVVGVALWGYGYFTAALSFGSPCGGVFASEVTSLEAGHVSEFRAAYREGERFGVSVCHTSEQDGVVIENIRFPVASRSAMQPVGVEVRLNGLGLPLPRGATGRLQPYSANHRPGVEGVLWFEMEYCVSAGSRISFDTVLIDYTYRHRSRTAKVPLGYVASIDIHNRCTKGVRADANRKTAAWGLAMRRRLVHRPPGERVGHLELTPENVSRDLCRYLNGVKPITDAQGQPWLAEFEPLEDRRFSSWTMKSWPRC